MRLPWLILSIAILINVVVDWYIYCAIKKRSKSRKFLRVHLFSAIFFVCYIILGISLPRRTGSDAALLNIMWIIYSYLAMYLPKWFFFAIDLFAYIPCLWKGTRIRFISWVGIVVAVVVCGLMWWGAIFNRYNIDVVERDVEIAGLPDAFDGYRLVQFSDLHIGTYKTDTTFVADVVNTINQQNADVIVFTGDIVNRRTSELEPFLSTLSRLKATDGVYSILGNHDYGEYNNWKSQQDRVDNLSKLKLYQKNMGWTLLLNETAKISRGNDSIALIGVENWGDPPFSVYGDLPKSYPTLNDTVTKILLTHNPVHWTDKVADNDSVNIALTLSGHTHAMQLSLCGISPSAWRYDTWGGRYDDKSGRHILYVNIGIGTVGIPTRIGATPEITVITLRKAK